MKDAPWPRATALDSLGLTSPIVQSPMAWAGGIALAQAVQAAGALGSIPRATLDNNGIEAALTAMHQASGAPFNVNFFAHREKPACSDAQARWRSALTDAYVEHGLDPNTNISAPNRTPFSEEHCALLEDAPPAVVSFHFGLPKPALVKRVKAAGCQIWSTATTVAEARWLVDNGADAIIAQGLEAGGHRGLFLDPLTNDEQTTDDVGLIAHQVGTFALIPQIVDIVQIGTAFLFSAEATITSMHREALWTASAENTVLTNVFSGKPARSVVNNLVLSHGPMSEEVPPFPTAGAALAPLKAAAEAQSQAHFSSLWSGQSASLATRLILERHHAEDPPSATKLTQWIISDTLRSIEAMTSTQ